MITKKLLIFGSLTLSNIGFSQLDEFEITLDSMFSRPAEDGWMYFNTPNNYLPGACFQYYKTEKNDIDNDMLLLDVHTDSLTHHTHYKFQQLYKNVPVEAAGCIEHFDQNGNLIFTNAKHAIDINVNVIPAFNQIKIINKLIQHLPNNIVFAWENESWEQQIRTDKGDSSATWFPTPKLILAIDAIKDVHGDIDGSRYRLAYEIPVTILEPVFSSKIYYVDALTGFTFKEVETHIDVTADVYGYGNRNIDTKWRGGFIQKYELDAEDWPHNYHTKKWVSENATWNSMDDTRSSDENWGSTYLTETSTHYHVGNSWDYFYNTFGRNGMDGSGGEVRVKTQYTGTAANGFNPYNAYYNGDVSPNELVFGIAPTTYDLGMEPSIVGHEFTHGITRHTANLAYEYESGALNESFSDIFGTVIQAQTLDWGSTDWIIGNHIPNTLDFTRSMSNPQTRGSHWNGNYDSNGYPIFELGQPDYYEGDNWCDCPYEVDKGGVHVNSGVQNKWFQALTNGETSPSVQGIGMTKATRITYYALTSILMSSSQYYDSKNATIQAAIQLYGECSQEHKSTVAAWNHVGIYASDNCFTSSVDEIVDMNDVLVYPNPVSSTLFIELPQESESPIQIFDINGKLVKQLESTELYFQTDISNLENGVYLLHFDFKGQKIVKRIIVQK